VGLPGAALPARYRPGLLRPNRATGPVVGPIEVLTFDPAADVAAIAEAYAADLMSVLFPSLPQ